jgi:hypothetical protein
MSDAELLAAFGLPPDASSTLIHGKDGTSATYAAGGQSLTITRSRVSGVTVIAQGPAKGLWPLGRP